jgi:DNA polymerase-3 subunit delta'
LSLSIPDPAQVLPWLREQGVEHPETALAAAGGAPLGALKGAGTEGDRLAFVEGLGRAKFDPLALAESVQRVPLWDLVSWLQRWSFDLLLARTTGRVRYHLGQEKAVADIAARCEPANIAAYLRQLALARGLAKHPLNPKLFVEDLLLQYQRLTGRS